MNIAKLSKKLSLMHFNISSLPYHFDELSELLNDLTIKFKIISITESRLRPEKYPLTDINLPNHNIEHMATKANKGGALLFISNELKYKLRNNLQIHKDKKLESIFIEAISKSLNNVVSGCIYKHPNLAVTEFNEGYLQPRLDKLSLENKDLILMGDFNVYLLHCEMHNQRRDFLDKMFSATLKSDITSPNRVTPGSKTLIDNIFKSFLDEDIVCGNLYALPQSTLPNF